MTKQINEATLIPPAFCGDETEIASAMSTFSSIISSIGYMSAPVYSNTVGGQPTELSADNKKAILASIVAYATSKMEELCAVNTPPVVQPAVPSYQAPASPMAAPADAVEITYESKQESPMLKRMRELAGIPHSGNRV